MSLNYDTSFVWKGLLLAIMSSILLYLGMSLTYTIATAAIIIGVKLAYNMADSGAISHNLVTQALLISAVAISAAAIVFQPDALLLPSIVIIISLWVIADVMTNPNDSGGVSSTLSTSEDFVKTAALIHIRFALEDANGPLTISELAEKTDLTTSRVENIVEQLMEDRVVLNRNDGIVLNKDRIGMTYWGKQYAIFAIKRVTQPVRLYRTTR